MVGMTGTAGAAPPTDKPKPAKTGTSPSGPVNPKTIDFEGDVIEGQKKAPDLFLQVEDQKLNLDSVLYLRQDFNDFHAVDSKQRPRVADPTKSKSGAAKP
jgi:hypothetical protein